MRACLFILLLSVISSASAQDYTGTDFRIAFLKNINPLFNGDPIFEITVEAIQTADVTVEYGSPGDPFYLIQNQTINAGETFSFSFDDGQTLNQELLDNEENRSFHVTSTADVRAYGFHNRIYFSEATSILPTNSLGDDYLIMAYNDGNGIYPSLFNIIATENNTTVEVIPTAPTSFAAAGVPFNLNLDAGEVITISSEGDLTGSRVTSTGGQAIAIFAGQQQGLVGENCAADSHMYDQILPLEAWKDLYAIVPVSGSGGELMRVLASEDNTELFFGCDLLTTIDQGEFYETFIDLPFLLSSSEPVTVAMFTPSGECNNLNLGDPNMRTVLPLDQANTNVNIETNYWFQDNSQLFNVIHLVVPSDETGNIVVNGSPVNGWQSFPSNSDLSHVGWVVQAFTNPLSIESTSPFWSELVALAEFDAMTMNLGATTTMEIPPFIIDQVNLGPDETLCPGETLTLDTQLGQEGEWQDGTVSETYTVDSPGIYSVTIEGSCGDGSDEIEVFEGFLPSIELDENFSLCQGQSVEISIEPEDQVEYQWNTGDVGESIEVQSAGIYEVIGTSQDGCQSSAETEVLILDGPELSVEGPAQLCSGESGLLAATGDAGIYTWNDGSTGTSLEVNAPGVYSVNLVLDNGCSNTVFYSIPEGDSPIVFPSDSTFCDGNTFTFTVESPNAGISWPGLSDTEFLSVDRAGIYTYEAENECGSITGVVNLETRDCSCPTYVPNAFSPNGDGLNDLFRPVINCPVENYDLRIYNRWGNEVFASNDPNQNWNGASLQEGDFFTQSEIYFYIIRFDNSLQPLSETLEFSGSLTLLR